MKSGVAVEGGGLDVRLVAVALLTFSPDSLLLSTHPHRCEKTVHSCLQILGNAPPPRQRCSVCATYTWQTETRVQCQLAPRVALLWAPIKLQPVACPVMKRLECSVHSWCHCHAPFRAIRCLAVIGKIQRSQHYCCAIKSLHHTSPGTDLLAFSSGYWMLYSWHVNGTTL